MRTPTIRSFSLSELWYDFIDAHTNLQRAEHIAREADNGMQSALYAIVFALLTIVSAIFAWKFDLASTFVGLEELRKQIFPSLPTWALEFTTIFTAIITITPTLVEIFTARFARANIMVIKLFVFGMSAFDVITDIPVTRDFVHTADPALYSMGRFLGFIAHWVFFFGWLALATIGFQLSVAIFGYVTLIYLRKALVGMPAQTISQKKPAVDIKSTVKSVKEPGKDGVTVIET